MTRVRHLGTFHRRLAVLAFVALAAGACAGEVGGSLVELQTGLPTGNPAAWYTAKLDELGYRVASLRYERRDVLAYEVGKGDTAFSIQVTLEPEDGTATKIEIQEATAGAVTAVVAPDEPPATEEAPPAPAAGAAPQEPAARPRATPEQAPQATPEQAPQAAPESTPQASAGPVPVSQPATFVALPARTRIATLLNDPLDSGTSQVGDRFSMIVPDPVSVAGIEVLPAGSRIRGHVAEVQPARRPNTGGRLVLKADTLEANGSSVQFEGLVTAEGERLEGEGSVREDLKEIAAGAGVGGLVGGLLGGGKGVVAGILIGAGGAFVATKGEQVRLAPDSPLYVELREEVRVPVPR